MSAAPLLFANLGAEEGEAWRRLAAQPRVREAARLWVALFPAGSRVLESGPHDAALAAPLAPGAASAALELCEAGGLVPWLSTPEAAALAARERVPLAAAPPQVVAALHDKAFALAWARERERLPPEIAETAFALGAEELASPDTVKCRIEGAVSRWPAALRERFVLKPRAGTSGRGRLSGRAGELDLDALCGALPRLRARGGCVVEPWLARLEDLSAQLQVSGPGEVRILGTFVQVLSPQGMPLGHRALAGDDGARSGSAWDEELRDAALALGRAAAERGYTGACGVDAFSFRGQDGGERLRAVVELNARFTAGTSAAGLLARALRAGLARPGAWTYVGVPPAPFAAPRTEIFAAPGESALWVAPGPLRP